MKIMKQLWMILPLLMLGQTAHAVAPANAIITNTATLTYLGNTTGITASVNVGVTLKAAKPTLSAPLDNTEAEGQKSVASYTILANANGPDTYGLSATNAPTNITITGNLSVTFKQGATTVTSLLLGSTAANATAAAGATTIKVPSDGTANASLNGLANGDEVKIGAKLYLVNVTDTATGDQTITLIAGTLSTGAAAPTVLAVSVPVGTLITEQQTFTMEIANVGTKTVPANASTIDVTTSVATTGLAAVTDIHRTNVVQLSFEKFVRNVTNANSNVGATATAINGVNFFATAGGVSSTTGDVLEYAIQVITPASTGITAGATITDTVPTFTTYVANSTRLNALTVAGDGATLPLVGGLVIDADTARTPAAAASGVIAINKTATVTFKVTVD